MLVREVEYRRHGTRTPVAALLMTARPRAGIWSATTARGHARSFGGRGSELILLDAPESGDAREFSKLRSGPRAECRVIRATQLTLGPSRGACAAELRQTSGIAKLRKCLSHHGEVAKWLRPAGPINPSTSRRRSVPKEASTARPNAARQRRYSVGPHGEPSRWYLSALFFVPNSA
jgi:hypothetical protein